MDTVSSNRPRVFVSSTIGDFHDLRSAIKFWLEQHGYEANLSEYNDFTRKPDAGTFSSCFHSISTCHYYVLLVGWRRGSLYDEDNRVSVTQQEYRVAAELAKRNEIIPIVFVRQDVEAAARALASANSTDNNSVVQEGRKADFEDPNFTISFLREIRETEVDRIDPSGEIEPIWQYTFRGFEDVVNALQVTLNLRFPMRRMTALANIRQELTSNLTEFAEKVNDGIHFATHFTKSFADETEIYWSTPLESTYITIDPHRADCLWNFQLIAPEAGKLTDLSLQRAIDSGEFLEFEPVKASLEPSHELDVILKLRSQIIYYNGLAESFAERRPLLWAQLSESTKSAQPTDVLAFDVAMLLAMHNALENIIWLSQSLIYHSMDTRRPVRPVKLRPWSPLVREVDRVSQETVTVADVEGWVEHVARNLG